MKLYVQIERQFCLLDQECQNDIYLNIHHGMNY